MNVPSPALNDLRLPGYISPHNARSIIVHAAAEAQNTCFSKQFTQTGDLAPFLHIRRIGAMSDDEAAVMGEIEAMMKGSVIPPRPSSDYPLLCVCARPSDCLRYCIVDCACFVVYHQNMLE